MTVREYIGARYVPIFMGDWDIDNDYEPLSIVQYQGNSYTSRQAVPSGTEITNTAYWALTGNYNAQVEAYRQEVASYNSRITSLEGTVGDNENGLVKDVNDLESATSALETTVGDNDSGLVKDVNDLELAIQNIKDRPLDGKTIVIYGDSTFTETSFGTSNLCDLVAIATGATVINRCEGGTRLNTPDTGLIAKLQAASSADFNNVDYCFFAYCTNDWQDGTPISEINGDFSFENYLGEAWDLYKEKAQSTIPVWITPAGGYRGFTVDGFTVYQRNICGNTLEDYVDCAIDFCANHNIAVIDLYHTMGVNDTNISNHFTLSAGTIYVHYNQALKLRIAAAFDSYYPFTVPYSPYTGGISKLKAGCDLAYTETANNTQNAVLMGAAPVKAKSTPALLATQAGKTIDCNFSGDDTLIFTHKSGSSAVLVYVNNALYAIVNRNVCTAIRIKGVYSAQDAGSIKFASSNETTQYVCAPQLVPGKCKCVSGYGSQDWTLKTMPASWVKVSHSAGEFYYIEGTDFVYVHVRTLTLSENAGASTTLIELPGCCAFAASTVVNGMAYTSTGWTPTAFITVRSGSKIQIRPMVSLVSGNIIHIDCAIPLLIGGETTTTW